jgi:hypothetical protein
MLRTFCGTAHTSPKSDLTKEKNRPAKYQRIGPGGIDVAIAMATARGLNPCPGAYNCTRDRP